MMKRFLLLPLVLALLAVTAPAQDKVVTRKTTRTTAKTPTKTATKPHAAAPTTPAAQLAEGKRCLGHKQYKQAATWFRRAAEAGNAEAMAELGECYQYGRGVEKNSTQQEYWYRRSAELGCASGQHSYAQILDYRDEDDEAIKWFRKAAQQDYVYSQYPLASLLINRKEYAEALKWLRRASAKNYAPAQNMLGNCYEYGWGVEPSRTEASKWYRRAAKNGDYAAKAKIENEGF